MKLNYLFVSGIINMFSYVLNKNKYFLLACLLQ